MGFSNTPRADQLIMGALGLNEGSYRALTLTPAYGRDYKSKKAVEADWHAGKDFVINDMSHPDDGRYTNKEDMTRAGSHSHVHIRFNQNRGLHVIDLSKQPKS